MGDPSHGDDPATVHRRFVDEVVIAKKVELLDELFDPGAQVEQGSLDALRGQMEAQAVGFDGHIEYLN